MIRRDRLGNLSGRPPAIEKTRDGASRMKPFTMATIAVLGYLYYQRTNNDITIRMPKI